MKLARGPSAPDSSSSGPSLTVQDQLLMLPSGSLLPLPSRSSFRNHFSISSSEALPRAEAADPTPACATTAKPAYVCAREKAAQRTPPNKYDLTIWAQTESVLDGAAQTARVDVPAVPGAFLVRDVFSPTESGRLLALAATLGYERDEPLDAAARSRRRRA